MNRNRRIFTTAVAYSALLGALPAMAQSFPARPVRLIVPYGPGTATDLISRMLATNFATAPALYANLPYNSVNDFKPILQLTSNHFVFVVNSSFPVHTVHELIVLAKAKPGTIDYASGGKGSGPHLVVEMFAHMAGIKLSHIPYRATGPAVTDVLSGRVPLMATSISTLLPHIRQGKLRALAVSGRRRSSLLPDVPTVAEAGVPGFESKNWNGILAPVGLPDAIAAKLEADITRVLKSGAFESRLSTQAIEVELRGSEEFGRYITEEMALWKRVVTESGARVD